MTRTADEIAEALEEDGTPATGPETLDLCELANHLEVADAKYEALEKALNRVGLVIVDTTTDDDNGATVLEIVPVEDPQQDRLVQLLRPTWPKGDD